MSAREPTQTEIQNAGWAWRNDKDRETDSSDQSYFVANWRSLPGLGSYVEREITASDLREVLGEALAAFDTSRPDDAEGGA